MASKAMLAGTETGPTVDGTWRMVVQGACALAAAMGVGRFAYTPILPLMQTHAGLGAAGASTLATANYLGYLVGAIAASLSPRLARSTAVLRISLIVLVTTLAGMPLTHVLSAWFTLRAVAGAASALVFVVAANATVGRLRAAHEHRVGWVYGGVGAGIAACGLLVLALAPFGSWRAAWWAAALMTAALAVPAWRLPPPPQRPGGADALTASADRPRRAGAAFGLLLAGYVLEGAGYIVAGTFLVAALAHTGPAWLGSGAWVLVGLAAIPSCVVWAALSRSWHRASLLTTALAAQAVGIALPALVPGVTSAVLSALVFGGTFMGITTLALSAGSRLGTRGSAAVLTAGYATGQVLGPLGVAPLLHSGYHSALLAAAAVALAAAVCTAALRARSLPGVPARPRS